MIRIFAILLGISGIARAQFSDLAATADGSAVYFATSLRLKQESSLQLPSTQAIYRANQAVVTRVTTPPAFSTSFPQSQSGLSVSDDGTVVAYTTTTSCVGGSSCYLYHPTTYESTVLVNGKSIGGFGGSARVSPNGKFFMNVGSWSAMGVTTSYQQWHDLTTGTTVTIPGTTWLQPPANDGRILTLSNGKDLWFWTPQSTEPLSGAIRDQLAGVDAQLDPTATIASYSSGVGMQTVIHSLNLKTGTDHAINTGLPPTSRISRNSSATLFLFIAANTSGDPMNVYLTDLAAGTTRAVTSWPEGAVSVALSGDRFAFASSASGRLVRIDLTSGDTSEWIPATPIYTLGFNVLLPGSILPIRGSSLSAITATAGLPLPATLGGVRILAGTDPLPLLSISPSIVWFQVPFEWSVRIGTSVNVQFESDSPFNSGGGSIQIVDRKPYFFTDTDGYLVAAHQDFATLVTPTNPAHPNEIVHLFAIGLGPVTPAVTSGMPTPQAPLSRLTNPFDCRIGFFDNIQYLETLFSGLAPGLVGIYQVDVRLPASLPGNSTFLHCGFPENDALRHGGSIPVTDQP